MATTLSKSLIATFANRRFWTSVLGEFIATTVLIFIGCGSMLFHLPQFVNLSNSEAVKSSSDIIHVALSFGLTFTVLIAAFSPTAVDCHLNPAVSIGLAVTKQISIFRAIVYSAAQIIGAIAGSGLLYFIVPTEQRGNLGATTLGNGISQLQGFFIEMILTFLLVFVVSSCTDRRRQKENQVPAALTIGLTVAALHLKAIPYTGASFNPARSFGPALLTMTWSNHWLYWAAPISGGICGSVTYRIFFRPPSSHRSSLNRSQALLPGSIADVSADTLSLASSQLNRRQVNNSSTTLNTLAIPDDSLLKPPKPHEMYRRSVSRTSGSSKYSKASKSSNNSKASNSTELSLSISHHTATM